jgi:NADPH-dependent 2,4-dienoyl-CoA reductase/sulfur reductase-like enzyme/ferredoxin
MASVSRRTIPRGGNGTPRVGAAEERADAGREGMRIIVDLTRCEGYAQCAFAAPTVFKMGLADALQYNPSPSQAERERVLRAAAACPVQAIHVAATGRFKAPLVPRRVRPAARRSRAPSDRGVAAFKRSGRVVIIGASMAGLAAASALRAEGFAGALAVIGDEPHLTYDRPPLSKQVLTGWLEAGGTRLPRPENIDERLGVRAVGLDLDAKRVHLADGQALEFDRVLIATGTRARQWPSPAEAALDGVMVLRTDDDAARLRERLAARPRRVLVVGGGFTGSEIASDCREIGVAVTLAERGAAPLSGALGGVIGRVAADLQRGHGVDLRCGVAVTRLEGDARGRLRRAHLSDGSTLDAEVAVVALGAVRDVRWLRDAGLAATSKGLACDTGCRAYDLNGLIRDDVFVAGDVGRFPHPLYDYRFMSLEHWGNAIAQARIAAHNMVCDPSDRWAHLAVPVFWSSQFGINIKAVGVATFADEVVIAQGSVAERRFVAAYGYKGRVVAAVGFDQAKWLEFYERMIDAAAPFPPSFHSVDQPAARTPVPAEMPHGARTPDFKVVITGQEPSERRARWVELRR